MNGWINVAISYNSTPNEYTSTLKLYGSQKATSGHMYLLELLLQREKHWLLGKVWMQDAINR
jgi:hypothetical protein